MINKASKFSPFHHYSSKEVPCPITQGKLTPNNDNEAVCKSIGQKVGMCDVKKKEVINIKLIGSQCSFSMLKFIRNKKCMLPQKRL